MGSDEFYPEERPVHPVSVDGFWMDEHPVTVADFRRFVKATGYVTVAERPLDPADFPGAEPAMLVPGSLVFHRTRGPVDLSDVHNWWAYVPGASWSRPEGPDSSTVGRDRHPVTQVAFEDAAAYATWAGKTLATEAEWEYAARGGLDGARFAWGDEFAPKGRMLANTWQGEFPWQNTIGRRLRGNVAGALLPAQRIRALRRCGQRVGMDGRLLRAAPHRPGGACVLCAAQPADDLTRGLVRARPTWRAHPTPGDQGRLPPVCAELLPALPPSRSPSRDRRHEYRPYRLPLHRQAVVTRC